MKLVTTSALSSALLLVSCGTNSSEGLKDPNQALGPAGKADNASVGAFSCTESAKALAEVPLLQVPSPNVAALAADDAQRASEELPPRFADPFSVDVTPKSHGRWLDGANGEKIWELRFVSKTSKSLNFGFTKYGMPVGGELYVYSKDCSRVRGPFTHKDNEAHGQLWTPLVEGDEAVIRVVLPKDKVDSLQLALTSVNRGYRDFADLKSGACNVDVVCSEGDEWRDQIRSVGVISKGGSTFCTGFLVNNTAGDHKPYFMTANHCRVTADSAPSLVVFWNYEASECGGARDGELDQFQTGSIHRASGAASDFTIVELDDAPAPEHNVYWAGWDRSTDIPTSAVGIHHPRTDEKAISFEDDPLMSTSYGGTEPDPAGNHLRVIDWDIGTTEPGSSGSPLFNQDHRIVGQLHGGGAACGNDESDYYGWFAASWEAGLADWLDEIGLGVPAIDGLDSGGGCVPPVVAIDVDNNPAEVGEPVAFASDVRGGAAPYTYAWDVDGDGQEDSDESGFTHVYSAAFEGNVVLSVVDSEGCRASSAIPMSVGEVNEGGLLINELLTDPPSDYDANGDGKFNFGTDEFIELINTGSGALDLSGATISDEWGLRVTIPTGMVLEPGEVLVVFGGSAPELPGVKTIGGSLLGMNNGGDTVTVRDAEGNTLDSVSYGSEGGKDSSLVREVEGTASGFVLHKDISDQPASPGTRANGSPL